MQNPYRCDVLVVGDEVESILTAVSAARAGTKVTLVRRSQGPLGGLSVRGSLSYMDITLEYVSGIFKEFLSRAGVVQVGLDPNRAHQTLLEMLTDANIDVFNGVEAEIEIDTAGFVQQIILDDGRIIQCTVVIDATPDADTVRKLGIPYIIGLGGILGKGQNFLGVSPVFRITGISVEALRSFEERLRQKENIRNILARALPFHPTALREEYVTRPTFAPPDKDYLDILNPVIGIYFYLWRYGEVDTYSQAAITIDGGNISRLPDRSLGFNGLVARPNALAWDFDDLLAMSQGGPVPQILTDEMGAFAQYLRDEGRFTEAKIIPPDELYVRQTLNLLAKFNMTAAKMLSGGAQKHKAVGTFSYWLDLRGTQLWEKFPGEKLPKPVFNLSLDVCLPTYPQLENIAFVSRSAGYSPIGQGAGRIIQHNSLLGEALGIAASLAILSQTTLSDIAENAVPQIQEILKYRHGELKLEGSPTMTVDDIAQSQLLKHDTEITEHLRKQITIENVELL